MLTTPLTSVSGGTSGDAEGFLEKKSGFMCPEKFSWTSLTSINTSGNMTADLFKSQYLRERQCIAYTTKGKQCGAHTSQPSLSLASIYMSRDYIKCEQKGELIKAVIRLLICGNHKDAHLHSQFNGLVEKYQPELEEYARTHEPHVRITHRRSSRNTKTTMRDKLYSVIKDDQFQTGSLYIFTWSCLEGYVKVGCTKGGSAKRIKQWSRCYPGAVEAHSMEMSFPQRMEELIHLQMAGRRYDISCYAGSCVSGYHDEWFECSVEEMRIVIDDWSALVKESELYSMNTRRLTGYWTDVLAYPSIESEATINPRTLVEAARMSKLTAVLEGVHVDKD